MWCGGGWHKHSRMFFFFQVIPQPSRSKKHGPGNAELVDTVGHLLQQEFSPVCQIYHPGSPRCWYDGFLHGATEQGDEFKQGTLLGSFVLDTVHIHAAPTIGWRNWQTRLARRVGTPSGYSQTTSAVSSPRAPAPPRRYPKQLIRFA